MMMIAVCVILAFQFIAVIDSSIVVIQHGTVCHVNCTSGEYPGRIYIQNVDFNSTLCNRSQLEVESQIFMQCHNHTECALELEDITECSTNETLDALVEIIYYCAFDGGWSKWGEFSACSLTCGGGIRSRYRKCNAPVPNMYGQNCSGSDVEEISCNTNNCSNPHFLTYNEGEMADLTCSDELNETILTSNIQYFHGSCNHTDVFGLQNLCEHKSICTFEVNNSNVGSSCGGNGRASLEITYLCKRDGGWSEWSNDGVCSATCGGGLQKKFRECTNPARNEVGNVCAGDTSLQEICNNQNCAYDSNACIYENLTWTCQGGYIEINLATWRTGQSCGKIKHFMAFDVKGQMEALCSNKTTCLFYIEDATFNVSCREPDKICTQLDYLYTCYKAQWEAWTEWGVCSKSCGIGFQSRSRNCIGKRNTSDGYAVDCDGNSSENRSCNINVCSCVTPIFQPVIKNVEIPDHTAVNSRITSLPLLEPDYTNYWQYVRFDFGNEYLYIDTHLRSLHVKKPLPHIIGQLNTTHKYTLTIFDACKNTVTSSIFVLSFNAPPVIHGLKDVIQIDISVLRNMSLLTSFKVVDQSGDNVSCNIEETTPTTATVFLNRSGHDMGLHLIGNASLTEMSVIIACSDGTNMVKVQPVIKFISGEQFKSNGTNVASIVVPVLVVLVILVAVAVWYLMKRRRMLMSVKKLSDYVVTHKLSSDDEDDLGEINPASQHKDENEHAYTSLPKADENKSSNSASFKLAATKGEYVEAWR